MKKESKLKIVWDYVWITVITAAVILGSVTIPMSCNAARWPNPRLNFFQSPTIELMFAERMDELREMRQINPEYEFFVQVWADMDTGIWNMYLGAAKRTKVEGKVNWFFILFDAPGATPYEFRAKTGHEVLITYWLEQFEWFYGKEGGV